MPTASTLTLGRSVGLGGAENSKDEPRSNGVKKETSIKKKKKKTVENANQENEIKSEKEQDANKEPLSIPL